MMRTACSLFLATPTLAQDPFGEGPQWRFEMMNRTGGPLTPIAPMNTASYRGSVSARTPVACFMLVFFLIFIAAGCADLGGSKIYDHPLLTSKSRSVAEVFVIRPKTFAGFIVSAPIYFDDEILLRLRIGTYAQLFIRPGQYDVRTGYDAPKGGWVSSPQAIKLNGGNTHYFLLAHYTVQEAEFPFTRAVYSTRLESIDPTDARLYLDTFRRIAMDSD